jgi:acyl-CoA oxidase
MWKLASITGKKSVMSLETKMFSTSSRLNWDKEESMKLLDHHNHDTRAGLKKLFKDPLFTPKYNMTLAEERQKAYDQLKKICDSGLFSVKDFWTNPRNIFAAHEVTGMTDPSTTTKLTVQFNLFGGTVLKLGTEHHHKILDDIDNFSKVGCFALTELAYGNNAVEMETTAHYDKEKQEFIINTPSTKAQKYWITNGAIHAHYAIVFARLIHEGVDEGLHGFLVNIRDQKDLSVMDGCKVWDMGYKIGLNGVDNAALWFDKVRVPRLNLLNATSNIDENGNFTSKIDDKSARRRKRFIVLADQLLSGRVCIASMTIGSVKLVLDQTVQYASTRPCVGTKGKSDYPIMGYQLQNRQLMPLIAQTYGLNFLLNYVQDRYANQTEEDYAEVVRLCCVIKPLVTWHSENTVTVCRERCGGQGFLSANRFGEGIAGAHAGMTAEGDNSVIQQKVSKELLETADYEKVFAHVQERQASMAEQQAANNIAGDDVTSADWLLKVYQKRQDWILNELASKMFMAKSEGESIFDTWMLNESDNIQALALAYGENLAMQQFAKTIDTCEPVLKPRLNDMFKLYALDRIMNNGVFFLQNGVINADQSAACTKEIQRLCKELGDVALDLTKGFGIPDHMHHAPIANDWVAYNRIENNGELEDKGFYSRSSLLEEQEKGKAAL